MSAPHAVFLAGLAVWLVSLGRPGWTRRRLDALRRRWRLLAPTCLGLGLIGLADPFARLAPVGVSGALWRFWAAPGLAGRAALLLFVATPLLADVAPAPDGARVIVRRALARLRWTATWVPLPLIAAALAAHHYGGTWSRVLGGNLAPAAAAAAPILLGANAPPGTPSAVDAALIPAVDAMVLAAVLAVCVQRFAAGVLRGGVVRRPALGNGFRWLRSPAATALCCAGILLLAFHTRWQFLVESLPQGNGLSADGRGYFDEALALDQLAQQHHVNYLALFFQGSTYSREPVYIYLLRGWLALTGAETLHAQYFSLVASLVWIAIAIAAVWALLGRWPALLAGLLLAADGVWIRNGVIGLREEVAGAFLASAVALLFSSRARATGLSWLAPVCAALAGLTRLDAMPCALFMLAWAALAQRWPWRRALLMGLLCAAVLMPALGGYERARGTPFPAATVISTNNWRDEFQDRLGTPGFEPDRQVTAFDYLFHYHTPAQIAFYTVRGAVIIYGTQVFDSLYYRVAGWSSTLGGWGRLLGLEWRPLIPLTFALGCLLLLAQPRRWRTRWLPVALCVAGVLPPIGFSAGVPGHMMYQARYGYLVSPFATAILAWTICAALVFIWRCIARSLPALWTRNQARILSPLPRPSSSSPLLSTQRSALSTSRDLP